MKRTVLVILLIVSSASFAQKQTGYVRTVQKADRAAKYLSGVTIKTKEYYNNIKTGNNGFFTIPITAKDRSYTLTSVAKEGYTLVDDFELYNSQEYSLKPKVVLMISKADEERQIKKLTEKLRKQYNDEYLKKLHAIRDSSSALKDSLAKNYEKLLADMHSLAKRLVRFDYEVLSDSIDIAAAQAYEEGNFEEAIAILRKKPSLVERLQKRNEIEAQRKEITERDLKECDMYIDLYKSKYKNDSALFYMKLKHALKPYNKDYMLDISDFASDYLAQYDTALVYCNKALEKSNGVYRVRCNNGMGNLFFRKVLYDSALMYYGRALKLGVRLVGENNLEVANTYNGFGTIYAAIGKYDSALTFYYKALKIDKTALIESDIAAIYNNMGDLFFRIGKYDSALTYHKKSLESNAILGKNHPDVARNYNNIGVAYSEIGEKDSAITYLTKSLQIWKMTLGEYHPDLAVGYLNVGNGYLYQSKYDSALAYYKNAMKIEKTMFGDNNTSLTVVYCNIGEAYRSLGVFDSALFYQKKSLQIFKNTFNDDHPDLQFVYNNIGLVYNDQGKYDSALVNYKKSLRMREKTFGENNLKVATSCYNIGCVFNNQSKYDSALAYYKKTLTIEKKY